MANKKINKDKARSKKTNPKVRKIILTLFLFLLPLLVIAFTEELMTKILLFFYEGVLLQNFIRDKINESY